MKANELRIGNWVSFFNMIEKERYIQVNARFFASLAGGRMASEMRFDEELNGYYHPISLTSEILKKCGFVDRKLGNFYFLENGNLTIEGYEHDYNGLFIGNIESMHQLQNLYFALTGTELEINL